MRYIIVVLLNEMIIARGSDLTFVSIAHAHTI